ncbi:ATP-dependent DNA helicase RecG [Mycolicibacterium conceptionense]|uniref:ATP-dependent DNA helicase RecG n=1 Tax=Mycolicibacterium conceptionense TaxID=451644 RepID=A0A0U1DCI5_9MYCO|nr:ATP-dependent DNA helicase RecG [Mycolicibacterium conceptionense]ORV26600.1 ATP-dependent DNA helicase RecG [Mycolicibacterium conceptionense]CQD11697.1 ATP-dependent DNA helicase RecG [Mycolicibacterium conceptionense]
MVSLSDRLDFVLGARAAKPLEEHFGIVTVNDLLRHYPRKYSDGMSVRGEGEALDFEEGEHVTFIEVITETKTGEMKPTFSKKTGRPKSRTWLRVTLGEHRPTVTATFFNAGWMVDKLPTGTRLMLSGEVKYFRNNLQLDHPAFLVLNAPSGKQIGTKSLKTIASASGATGEEMLAEFERDFFPIYPASAKVQSWDIYACVRQTLDVLDPVPDPLPESFVREHNLMTEDEALRAIHLAQNTLERERAQERLTFDEAIGLQWALVGRRYSELSESGPAAPPVDHGLAAAMRTRMPFELTAGQSEVLEVISGELASTRPMNRMLQGEVGSGKTIVSVLAMLQMVDAGYQCALLAPTEVLAAQHARSIRDVLGPLAMAGELGGAETATGVALLTGSMTAPQKRAVRAQVASGQAGIVVGTHALLQEAVEFHNLGMVVVDEQHRFGVEQRDTLRAKARDGLTPHLLVMTATPIPRTVALTVYGDLETSTLRELPRGRQPIATNTIFVSQQPSWLDRAWARIREEVDAGRQAYVVASRIDESDKPADKNDNRGGPPPITVVDLFDRLSTRPLSGLRLGLMHGRLSGDEKDAVMGLFRAGEIDVLVCTTVIEVGVDVPNATMMVVMDADRFGVSQLHQLRGRIGRGQHPSLCLLATRLPETSKAGERIKAVAATLDGFALADLDLDERREGDVLGLNQSGRAINLRFLSLRDHLEVIQEAREFCERRYEQSPHDPGMDLLAAQFVNTDRVEYLDKS